MNALPHFSRLPATMENAEIGPYLRSLREHYKLSLDDVGERLHIRPKYIAYIESNELNQLPGKVYARGYVYNYSEFLGVDPAQVVERLFGSTTPKPDAFYVPAATPHGSFINSRILLFFVLLGLMGYAGYYLLHLSASAPKTESSAVVATAPKTESTPPSSTVMPLPNHVVAEARNAALPNTRGVQCLHAVHGLDCGVMYRPVPQRHFVRILP